MKVYEDCKITGPYLRPDGRQHMIVTKSDGIKTSISYPKYLVEIHLNKYLAENETIDHIDRNFTNNKLSNLQIIDRSNHAKLDVLRLKPKAFFCPTFDKLFVADGIKLQRIRCNLNNHKKFGPFCSRSCAGKYSKAVQLGLICKIEPKMLILEYYQLNKSEQ